MDMFLEKRENVSSQAYSIGVYMELAECNMDIKLNASKNYYCPVRNGCFYDQKYFGKSQW